MYDYRNMTPEQQAAGAEYRRLRGYPLHEPPHFRHFEGWFLITAATYEHKTHFANEEDRHWLLGELLSESLRRLHARTARELSRRDGGPGRRVWCRFADRLIRSEGHYYTTLNYIHYNPVKHRCAMEPLQWLCSSVHWYLEHEGIEWLRDAWRSYPLKDYGKGWDL
jgi:putative transposase